jgi:hypothetical protein
MFASISPEHIAVMIPIVAVLGTFAVVIVAVIVEGRKKDLVHKERLFALEKGLPLPEPPDKETKPVHATRRAWGLVWLGLGLALIIALALNPDSAHVKAWGFALIPLFIGIGLVVASVLDKREFEQRKLAEEKHGPVDPPMPHV